MNSFENKQELYNYLISKFLPSKKDKDNGTIILRGSMVNKPSKNYCDFDLEIYKLKPQNPYYELTKIKDKVVLITIWFGKYYSKETTTNHPKNIKVIHGKFYKYMSYIEDTKEYKGKEKTKRECQSVIDHIFKFLRHKNIENLESINKRIQ